MRVLRRHKFSKLYDMSSGISTKPEQAGHGAPFLSFSTVFAGHFLPPSLPDQMDTSDKEQETYSIKEGDIFLTRTSETLDELGMSCVATSDYPKATYSGFLKRLRPTQKDQSYHKFMAFYLRSKTFRKAMDNNAVMTLRCSLNEQIFSYLDLLLPDFDEQVKIGDFLYLLYQKIELNNQINAELEAMAKLLYDYWFVQFDFPMTAAQAASLGRPALEGHPYKSSGGKMVHNPTLNRQIPDGWAAGTLHHFISNDKTGDWGQDEPTGNYTEKVTCIRGTDLNALNGAGLMEPPTRFILKKNLTKRLLPNDLIIEISGGSPTQSTGRPGLITSHTLERFSTPLICSNFCKAISIRKETWSHYFLQSWKSLYDNGVLFSWEGKTSGIKNFLFDSFVQHHKVAIPPDNLLEQFHAVIEPQHAQRQKLLIQNQELTQLRDWLLPMLMNGQVTVS